jgi:murein DD-endopeptidase MepM/ murein hydrolase activator NlpD
MLWPVEGGRLWRGFGRVRRRHRGRLHKGLDIGAPEGSPIMAAADGLVVYSDNEVSGYGNLLMVVHSDRSVAFYAHCRATYVFAGQTVRKGQIIGEVGQTGLAHGAHLHFELRVNGRPRNPLPRFPRQPPPRRAGRT